MKSFFSFSTIVKCLVVLLIVSSCKQKEELKKTVSEDLLPQIEVSLDHLVNTWYPRSIDTINGGFFPDFDAEWNAKGGQNKMLVTQARHIWTASTLAMHYGDDKYQEIANHGYEFLKDNMWDDENGGFYTLKGIADDGSLKLLSNSKSAYGNSFAIYGLATYYKVSKDTMALNLAKKTFQWLEDHSYDSEYGGYFDVMKQDGSWLLDVTENTENYDGFIRKDWKDQNSSIHLLECFTALYEVWPNALLKQRLEELLLLVRDTITTEKGSLTLHLQRDWTPVSFKDSTETFRKANFWLDHISFGHDVETAFLMLEASHALGTEYDITLTKGKKMVDHALAKGWDSEKGGFYDGGYYFDDSDVCTIENSAKVWWTQAEGLNSLLLMSKLFPKEKRYYPLFEKQWSYLDTYMIDHKNGGWYGEGLDSKPEAVNDAKAQVWKVNYHNIRALVNVIQMLKGEFVLTKEKH